MTSHLITVEIYPYITTILLILLLIISTLALNFWLKIRGTGLSWKDKYTESKNREKLLADQLSLLANKHQEEMKILVDGHRLDVEKLKHQHAGSISEMEARHKMAMDKTKILSQGKIKGHMNQILGSFVVLNDYDDVYILGGVSSQAPVDLLGLKTDVSIDFIEIKTSRTNQLSTRESMFRRLIEEKRVGYRVVYGNLNDVLKLTDKKLRKLTRKSQAIDSYNTVNPMDAENCDDGKIINTDTDHASTTHFGIGPTSPKGLCKPRALPKPDIDNEKIPQMVESLDLVYSAKCPKCSKEAKSRVEVRDWFGYHVINGRTLPYAWCINCRQTANNETGDVPN